MKRPIAIGLAPNLESIDAKKALSIIFKPWGYTHGGSSKKLEEWFEKAYPSTFASSFVSGRGALFAILQCLHLKKNDEVLVQAFTCKAVIEPILALGLNPVYIDIQTNFTLSKNDVLKKITKKTKVLVLQHTFGIPNIPIDLIDKIKQKGIFIIEDMAHCIDPKQKKIGMLGDAAIFSFGRDKAFSSVSGGMSITSNKILAKRIKQFHSNQTFPSCFWIFQNIFHSVSFYFFILPFYDTLQLGKIALVLLQRLHLLSLPVEENGEKDFWKYCQKFPQSLAFLVLLQLERIEEFNSKREKMVSLYNNIAVNNTSFSGSLLRFPFFTDNPIEMKLFFREHHIYLGDWYSHIIDPKSTNLKSIGYVAGSCPTAEEIASHIVNLPTYPTLTNTDREKIAMILISYVKSKGNQK